MTTKERLDRHDRQIAAIRNLVETGMRLVVGTRQDIRLLAQDLRALATAQRKTEQNLQALIDTMRRSGGNGHKRKVDIQ